MTTNSDVISALAALHSPPPPRRVYRPSRLPALGSAFGAIFIGAATMFMAVFTALAFRMQWELGLFMAACVFFMGSLTGYVWRDFRGKWGLRVVLDAYAVTLDLPAGRSLIHRPPAQHLIVPYADIAAIDSRYEAYGSLGMAMMQRAYVLHRKSGELIFLFEERALATNMASSTFTAIVADLAARAGVKVQELGTVEGKGGLLGVWGTHAPDWAAPPLPRQQAMRLWRHAASTGSLAVSFTFIVILMMWAFGTG